MTSLQHRQQLFTVGSIRPEAIPKQLRRIQITQFHLQVQTSECEQKQSYETWFELLKVLKSIMTRRTKIKNCIAANEQMRCSQLK